MNFDFWRSRKVLITGHTGFKGAWLSLLLKRLGADVAGFSLAPPTRPSLFELCGLHREMTSFLGDIRDYEEVRRAIRAFEPQVVIHMAAQPLVRESYREPLDTYSTNVMGTLHVLEAMRHAAGTAGAVSATGAAGAVSVTGAAGAAGGEPRAVVNVTTDKVYDNREWAWGYREIDPLLGSDPYANSKACSELVTSAYRSSFFPAERYAEHRVGVASARAGNVIGGGDWAKDRIVPDCVRAALAGEPIAVRNPGSVRPWQHALDPLTGYLTLAERLVTDGPAFSEAWNFGPSDADARTVEWIVRTFCAKWGERAEYRFASPETTFDTASKTAFGTASKTTLETAAETAPETAAERASETSPPPHENAMLRLDCSKARSVLGWRPVWDAETAVERVVEWTKRYRDGESPYSICLSQIDDYLEDAITGRQAPSSDRIAPSSAAAHPDRA